MYRKHLNKVVTLITPMGEIIGRLIKVEEDYITLKNPRLFVHAEGSGSGFAPGISMTGQQNPAEASFPKSAVLSLVEPHEQIENGWQGQTSGIVLGS